MDAPLRRRALARCSNPGRRRPASGHRGGHAESSPRVRPFIQQEDDMPEATFEARCADCKDVLTRDWYAWNNRMPPPPDDFHVTGEVRVANPGIEPLLVPKEPQGINPAILLMDLILCQRPGVWPDVLTWRTVRYDKTRPVVNYELVQVFCGGDVAADVKVEIVW